jgi:hypothetical protein
MRLFFGGLFNWGGIEHLKAPPLAERDYLGTGVSCPGDHCADLFSGLAQRVVVKMRIQPECPRSHG